MGLTVAVTGPTGDIGVALMAALEAAPEVERIVGMARRPFDPAERGWRKLEYRRGDVTNTAAVEALVAGADVVVHLAFVILDDGEQGRRINLEGSRNVFAAAIAAGAKRLVYASSVAAYGFHPDLPEQIDEDQPARGSDHYYSAQKAQLEALLAELTDGADIDAYVFRPCIVAGPGALVLIENIPYVQLSEHIPEVVRRLFEVVPVLKPVIPDPGVPFQLVHQDDVASAMLAAVLGRGAPGAYNLAGEGTITMSDVADELGYYAVSIPELAVDATVAIVSRLPFLPAEARWISAISQPMLMDTTRARSELGWEPRHDARETLRQTVEAARAERLIR